MDDLPKPVNTGNNQVNNNVSSDDSNHGAPTATLSGGVGSKELEGGIKIASGDSLPLSEVGKEIELSEEIEKAGVKIHPTTIQIPQPVRNVGVMPAGQNVTVTSGTTIVLPLTDDEIAQGLNQGINSSWRWLAEFCLRRLRRLHIMLKTISGRTVEVR